MYGSQSILALLWRRVLRTKGTFNMGSCLNGIKVIKPFDKAFYPGDDFFIKAGKAALQRFDLEDVAFEHWGPDCKLMSAARGRPILLEDGSTIPGPQAVRSSEFPMGIPALHPGMRLRIQS